MFLCLKFFVTLHPKLSKMKILITGASGFIGSFIVEEALRRGFETCFETWAAVRKSSSREWLKDERINFIELNLSSKEQLKEQLKDKAFDYVVHAAGVTKCLNKQDFRRINTEGTKNLVDALLEVKMPLKRLVFVSSLSVFGAIREQAYTLYYIKTYRRIRSQGEGLLYHGEEHQAALRLRCGLSPAGHHFRLCGGRGAGHLPCP